MNTATISADLRPSFTGKERDSESGFYYFGARYHDSALLTSFLSVDPLSDKYPNLSPYAYCAWNTMKLVDPDGEKIWLPSGRAYSTNMSTHDIQSQDDIATIEALKIICKSEEGMLMVDYLCKHENDININIEDSKESHCISVGPSSSFYDVENDRPGTGDNMFIDIYWNRNNPEKIPTLEGMKSNSVYSLLDEICHAYDCSTGWGRNDEAKKSHENPGEFQAVYRSNVVRAQLGDNNYRMQYTLFDDNSGCGTKVAKKTKGGNVFFRPCWYPQAKTDKQSHPLCLEF